jgi:hypothetical protein
MTPSIPTSGRITLSRLKEIRTALSTKVRLSNLITADEVKEITKEEKALVDCWARNFTLQEVVDAMIIQGAEK